MSLAQPTSYQSSLFSSAPSPFNPSPFNPFGHTALAPESVADSTVSESSIGLNDGIIAPQGRVPLSMPNFAPPPLSAVGGNKSHIDFIRGFGLDVPLESEEEQEAEDGHNGEQADDESDGYSARDDPASDGEAEDLGEFDDGETTGPRSRMHSRHVSKLSAALSLRSVGGNFTAQFGNGEDQIEQQSEDGNDGSDEAEKENEPPRDMPAVLDPAVEEWTGSEDVYLEQEESDDEVSLTHEIIESL